MLFMILAAANIGLSIVHFNRIITVGGPTSLYAMFVLNLMVGIWMFSIAISESR